MWPLDYQVTFSVCGIKMHINVLCMFFAIDIFIALKTAMTKEAD